MTFVMPTFIVSIYGVHTPEIRSVVESAGGEYTGTLHANGRGPGDPQSRSVWIDGDAVTDVIGRLESALAHLPCSVTRGTVREAQRP